MAVYLSMIVVITLFSWKGKTSVKPKLSPVTATRSPGVLRFTALFLGMACVCEKGCGVVDVLCSVLGPPHLGCFAVYKDSHCRLMLLCKLRVKAGALLWAFLTVSKQRQIRQSREKKSFTKIRNFIKNISCSSVLCSNYPPAYIHQCSGTMLRRVLGHCRSGEWSQIKHVVWQFESIIIAWTFRFKQSAVKTRLASVHCLVIQSDCQQHCTSSEEWLLSSISGDAAESANLRPFIYIRMSWWDFFKYMGRIRRETLTHLYDEVT